MFWVRKRACKKRERKRTILFDSFQNIFGSVRPSQDFARGGRGLDGSEEESMSLIFRQQQQRSGSEMGGSERKRGGKRERGSVVVVVVDNSRWRGGKKRGREWARYFYYSVCRRDYPSPASGARTM